ncbi:alpha/beta hydrolase [Streptomyces sp. NPDC055078]
MTTSRQHGTVLGYYDIGRTPFAACAADPRFSYCLYVPEGYDEDGDTDYPLVALIHGTDRTAAEYRNAFAEFCERHDCIVIAPLFPAGVTAPGELHDYKFLDYAGVRFDEIFLSMVDEVRTKYRVRGRRMLMHGFSGGGQFAHRFYYLHPDLLSAVSIGAPGLVTLLDDTLPWWAGTEGRTLDLPAMRRVAVQLVIGAEDTETWEITLTERDPLWVRGADRSGRTRLDRLASLHRSLTDAGIGARVDRVPGAAHHGFPLLDTVRAFFATTLAEGV